MEALLYIALSGAAFGFIGKYLPEVLFPCYVTFVLAMAYAAWRKLGK